MESEAKNLLLDDLQADEFDLVGDGFFEALVSGSKLEDRLNTSQNDPGQFDEGRTICKGDLIPASNTFKPVKVSEFVLPNECVRNF